MFEVEGGAEDSGECGADATDRKSVVEARDEIKFFRVNADGGEARYDSVGGTGN